MRASSNAYRHANGGSADRHGDPGADRYTRRSDPDRYAGRRYADANRYPRGDGYGNRVAYPNGDRNPGRRYRNANSDRNRNAHSDGDRDGYARRSNRNSDIDPAGNQHADAGTDRN